MATGKKRQRRSLTQRTRETAVIGQTMVVVVGMLGIMGGVVLAADEFGAGIGLAIGSAAWACVGYAVLLYIEWQVARAVLERRHAIATHETSSLQGAR